MAWILGMNNALNYYRWKMFTVEDKIFLVLHYIVIIKYYFNILLRVN